MWFLQTLLERWIRLNSTWSVQYRNSSGYYLCKCSQGPDPGGGGGGGGVLPKKLDRGVRRASQNPYPIYDQNLLFLLPYLWPDP